MSTSTTTNSKHKNPVNVRVMGSTQPEWLRETVNLMLQEIQPFVWPKTVTFAFAENACPIQSIPGGLCHIHNDPQETLYGQFCFAPGIMLAKTPAIWDDEKPTMSIMHLMANMAGKVPYQDHETLIAAARQRLSLRFGHTVNRELTPYEQALLTAKGANALWPSTNASSR